MIIDNTKINNFNLSEFPENPKKYALPKLIINLDKLRDFMGCAIFPSPVNGALARFDGRESSQHYAISRLSTGIDIFCDCDPFEAYNKILYSKLFNRIGIYFDTKYDNKPWVMFHIDLKNENLLWYRDEDYYYSNEKDFYFKLISKFNQFRVNEYLRKEDKND